MSYVYVVLSCFLETVCIVYVAFGIENLAEMYKKIYYEFAGLKYGGFYQMRPVYLIICDSEMISSIRMKIAVQREKQY